MNDSHALTLDDMQRLREEFPIVERFAYLNNAATSPIPRRARDAMHQAIDERMTHGNRMRDAWHDCYRRTRERLAALINATPGEIAFTKNTSEGLSFAANGIEWREGDNVIIPDKEFPSNHYPWVNLHSRGVEVRLAPVQGGRVAVDDVARLIDGRTRAVSVSFVRFDSGYRMDLAALGEVCRASGALFIVDAIQGLGALRLDVGACGIDLLSCGSYKWMMGPRGIGFLYVAERALAHISVSELGWLSVEDPYAFRYALSPAPGAARFEPGTENTVGIHGLCATLGLLGELGAARVEARVLGLNAYLRDTLERRGYQVLSPGCEDERSGILVFRSEHHASAGLVQRLEQAGVLVVARGDGIRAAPHYYNTEEEIDRLVEALPAVR